VNRFAFSGKHRGMKERELTDSAVSSDLWLGAARCWTRGRQLGEDRALDITPGRGR
jgi:hypothetical protein